MGLKVSTTKSTVIAITNKQAREIAARINSGKVKFAASAKMLGTASTAGRTRSTKVMKARLTNTRAKGDRISRLRRWGVNAVAWARTASIPGMTCGAELLVVADSVLKQLRSVINAAASAPGAGKNPLVSLWLHDCTGSEIGPAYTSHEQPVLQYAKAYYEKLLPMDTMRTTVDALTSVLARPRTNGAMRDVL